MKCVANVCCFYEHCFVFGLTSEAEVYDAEWPKDRPRDEPMQICTVTVSEEDLQVKEIQRGIATSSNFTLSVCGNSTSLELYTITSLLQQHGFSAEAFERFALASRDEWQGRQGCAIIVYSKFMYAPSSRTQSFVPWIRLFDWTPSSNSQGTSFVHWPFRSRTRASSARGAGASAISRASRVLHQSRVPWLARSLGYSFMAHWGCPYILHP